MKKILIYFLIMCICMTNVVYANQVFLLNPVKEIDVEWQMPSEIKFVLEQVGVENNLLTEETSTRTFVSGETGGQFTMKPLITTQDQNLIKFFDDAAVEAVLKKQLEGLSDEDAEIKRNDYINIINQFRACYKKGNVTNLIADVEYYILDENNAFDSKNSLDSGSKKFVLGHDNEKMVLLDANDYKAVMDMLGSFDSAAGTNGSSSGSGSFNYNTTPYTPKPKVFKDWKLDNSKYNNEFKSYDDVVRTAEFLVIENCWGEDCKAPEDNSTTSTENTIDSATNVTTLEQPVQKSFIEENNFMPETKKSSCGKVELKTSVKTYTFNLNAYYDQETEVKETEALILLTDHNLKDFEKTLHNDIPEQMIKDGIYYTNPERAEADAALARLVTAVRSRYGKIGVIAEEHKAKDFYVYQSYLTDIENKVFAQDKEGKLYGIRTDKYNDIYRQNELEGEMTDIVNFLDLGMREYRLQGTNEDPLCAFLLCEKCSKCDMKDCTALVASGSDDDPDNKLGLYFSKYCKDHACRFVWDWPVDEGNRGPKKEGLKCREQGEGENLFCPLHTCDACSAGIVGVTVRPGNGQDVRATGEKDIERYSKYCAADKCRVVECKEMRKYPDETTPQNNGGVMYSPMHCDEHETLCLCGCGTTITADLFDKSNGEMSCKILIISREVWGGTLTNPGLWKYDRMFATNIFDPYADTVVIFDGGDGIFDSENDINNTASMYCAGNKGLEDKNIIILGRDFFAGDPNNVVQYLQDLRDSGDLMSSEITFAGFSNGGLLAVDCAYAAAVSNLGVTTNALLLDGGTNIINNVDKVTTIMDKGGNVAAVSGRGGLYGDNGEIGPVLEANVTAVNKQLASLGKDYQVHLDKSGIDHNANLVQHGFSNMDTWFNN